MKSLLINTIQKQRPTRTSPGSVSVPSELPAAKARHGHPVRIGEKTNASLFFVGTATTILEWEGLRLMTDPNFLHAGDHVHLGPGVTATRVTNPAVNIEDLPHIDATLLSHYHADHFDEKVESMLRRDLPIITTPHAHSHLTNKDAESFTSVHSLDFWESMTLNFDSDTQTPTRPQVQVTGMPGTHVPPGALSIANDLLKAVPPTNGWMLELGYSSTSPSSKTHTTDSGVASPPDTTFKPGYRIYISGDTLLFDELHKIPEMYSAHTGKPIDLMLIHLGGTTIPSAKVPLVMVTMDAKMGLELVQVIGADVTIPIHYDDYDLFLSPLSDIQKAVEAAGLNSKVVYLDRGEEYRFAVKKPDEQDG